MISKKSFVQITASMLLAFATMPVADAQTTEAATPNPYKQCKEESGGDKAKFHSCIKAAKKAAFVQCASQAGFDPGQGQKPSPAEREKIHACMKAAGFKHHHHGQKPGGEGEAQQPAQQ